MHFIKISCQMADRGGKTKNAANGTGQEGEREKRKKEKCSH